MGYRTAVLLGARGKHARLVQHGIQQRGFLFITALHLRDAALRLDPVEHESGHIYRKGGRGIVHRAVFRHQIIAQHGGDDLVKLARHKLLADYDDGESGDAHILLRAHIREAEAVYIIFAPQRD